MMKPRYSPEKEASRGSAIITVTVILLVVLSMLGILFRVLFTSHAEQVQSRNDLRALYVAESGLGEAYLDIELGGTGVVGSQEDPRSFGDATYWVGVENLGFRVYALEGTGVDSGARKRIEVIVREIPDGQFQYAAFGKEGVLFSASSFVDSYDSSLGSYASQYESSAGYAATHGNVGSDGDIVMRTNSEIWGNATPGPEGQVIFDGPNATVSGTTQPMEDEIVLPPITVPAFASEGAIMTRRGDSVVLSGDHHFDGVQVAAGAEVVVQGPARIVFDDFLLDSNSLMTVDASSGPVEIYCTGDVVMRSNSDLVTHTMQPRDVSLLITSNNVDGDPLDTVEFSANSEYVGILYAPNAHVELKARFEVFGTATARSIHLASNSALHYDTNLLFEDDNGPPVFESVSWRPIALE